MGDVDAYDKDNKDLNVDVQVYPVEKKTADKTWETTHLAEVVLINAETVVTSRDYMLVLSRNAYTKDDTLWLNVVFEDGTAAEIEIDDKGDFDPEDTDYYMNAYAYVENSDGTYDIVKDTRIQDYNAELLLNGTVENTKNEIYALPDDADIWDVTDMKNAEDDVREGEFSYIECHSVIVPTTVNGRTVRTAYVWEIDDTTETPEQGAKFTDYVDEDPITGEINLYWHDSAVPGSQPSINEVRELMTEYLNEEIRLVQWDSTNRLWNVYTDDFWGYEVHSVRMDRISYVSKGGTENVYVERGVSSTSELDASADLKSGVARVFAASSIQTSTTNGNNGNGSAITYTYGVDGKGTGTFTWTGSTSGDVILSDAYQVTLGTGVTAVVSGTATNITSGNYVVMGTELDVTFTNSGSDDALFAFIVNDKTGNYELVDAGDTMTEDDVVVNDTLDYDVTDPTVHIYHNNEDLGLWADGKIVVLDTSFTAATQSAGYMTLLRNTVGGAATTTTGRLDYSSYTASYEVDVADADSNGVVAFYDASKVNKSDTTASNFTVTVDGITLNDNEYAAVGYVVTVTPQAGYAVTSVAADGTAITLTSGTLNTDAGAVTFEVPAVSTNAVIAVVVAAT